MKVYYADTNIFLRFILDEIPEQTLAAENYFKAAKEGKIKIVFISEIVMEIEYVLRKVYRKSRKEIAENLSVFIEQPHIAIPNRLILLRALNLYVKSNLDLVDLVLFTSAQEQGAKVLSFDKDFEKLEKLA